jgi:hypothetical protein
MRRQPELPVAAAAGLAVLQVSAIPFHSSRGEAANMPFNFLLLALTLFVWWGRKWKSPRERDKLLVSCPFAGSLCLSANRSNSQATLVGPSHL